MDAPEIIKHDKKTLAIVFRSGMTVPEGVHFYTPLDNPFQVGIHNRKGGTRLPPHIHSIDRPMTISVIQELLFVISGHIRITIYSNDEKLISKISLSEGDSILLMDGGHSVDFLTKTRLFEIKQGPYGGSSHAKIYFHT
jgi:hypothetical protein